MNKLAARKAHDWKLAISGTLLKWLRDPASFDADDGIDCPSPAILKSAIRLARLLRIRGGDPPDRITSDPNGGIVFYTHYSCDYDAVVHLWDGGSVEAMEFDSSMLIRRNTLAAGNI